MRKAGPDLMRGALSLAGCVLLTGLFGAAVPRAFGCEWRLPVNFFQMRS